MSKEKQIEERNELVDLLGDIGHDWDAYIDDCQENEERPQLSYEDFHADAILEAGYRKQSEWISVDERLPTAEEEERGLVGIVNGHNGKIRFTDAIIFVNYDFDEKEWWSQDYDITDCKVEHWMPLPEAPKGGAE